MSVMLDANVLTYLVVEEPDLGTSDHDCWVACRELVASAGSAKVSALAWFEVYRCQLSDGTLLGDRLDGSISKQLSIEPVDVSVAARAARLIVQARTSQQLCKRCLAPVGSKVCKSCLRTVGYNLGAQRRHDRRARRPLFVVVDRSGHALVHLRYRPARAGKADQNAPRSNRAPTAHRCGRDLPLWPSRHCRHQTRCPSLILFEDPTRRLEGYMPRVALRSTWCVRRARDRRSLRWRWC
jgi:hypothetical protein